ALGPGGLRRVAELCYHKAHYLAERVSSLDGWSLVGEGPFFNEFAVRGPMDARTVNARLRERGIIGGYALGDSIPGLDNALLICATELNSREGIDTLVEALAGIR
ncbi:MAG: glycine dehydrogenase, partial [Thermomicrobiaceae bacterium]|nr:glycine dehydrogenase [Thermomicrobiaceae bacterium]